MEGLSLREVARRAGVSRGAPYHHFKNKSAMVAAVAQHGFERITEGMRDVEDADPRQALRCCGHAYLSFALQNPTLYRLMFSEKMGELKAHPDLKETAECSFESLVERLAAWREPPGAVDDDLRARAMAVWATVHGMASLLIDGLGPEAVHEGGVEPIVEAMMALVEGGLPLVLGLERS